MDSKMDQQQVNPKNFYISNYKIVKICINLKTQVEIRIYLYIYIRIQLIDFFPLNYINNGEEINFTCLIFIMKISFPMTCMKIKSSQKSFTNPMKKMH